MYTLRESARLMFRESWSRRRSNERVFCGVVARVVTVAAGKGDILERREPKFVLVNCVKLARGGGGRWE